MTKLANNHLNTEESPAPEDPLLNPILSAANCNFIYNNLQYSKEEMLHSKRELFML